MTHRAGTENKTVKLGTRKSERGNMDGTLGKDSEDTLAPSQISARGTLIAEKTSAL